MAGPSGVERQGERILRDGTIETLLYIRLSVLILPPAHPLRVLLPQAYVAAIDFDTEPQSYRDVVRDPRWRKAMAEEIRALEMNKTWTIEKLTPGNVQLDLNEYTK
ncbi:hypothetical protein CRG98_012448 [Punica granatum]|uniref:Uncharacterized protein n=1 Tax=Punica granatum TaxID=22663 RepID=A0A2I0KFB8_PUNGR|nr:hypothetical protein CRG98_012448 [Punica granatum]